MPISPTDEWTYRNVVAFYFVASSESLHEAARCLDLSGREVTMMVRQLEDRLCTKLTTFTESSVALTPEGQALLGAISPCLSGLAEAIENARKGSVLPNGSISWKR
jgi:DNA-binding transcriptional LysR family regulator